MSWRGPAAVALLLGIGSVGGYAAAYALDDGTRTSGPATPVAAQSPSVPIDPPPQIRTDPAVAPLATDLPTHAETLGTGGFAVTFPAPDDWRRTDSSTVEAKWVVPGHPSHTYMLRVEQVSSQRDSLGAIVEERAADLDSATEDLVILEQTGDSLEFTYLDDGYLRHGLLRWLDVTGSGFAELEISVTGRERDVPGMTDLVETIAEGAR